ncbi:Hypothetical protein FKW44_021719 [Caligus rogercresseyi]|uniref:Uncharacterized protein n=1 Tax=Caligus rogercresseyi TaxID=217165 RepID=A0A7T8GRR3_CALRO|nr:Hypothetical protein FKW44_021719 [Caligus rogercresseyi]
MKNLLLGQRRMGLSRVAFGEKKRRRQVVVERIFSEEIKGVKAAFSLGLEAGFLFRTRQWLDL